MLDPIDLRFDRGTLRIQGAGADNLPFAVWDERVSGWRAPAHRYAAIVERVTSSGADLHDEIAPRLCASVSPWSPPDLRSYQRDALHAWQAFGCRGLVALPTGSGKTIVAIAALASVRRPALVVCPTRALLEQWERELTRFYSGPIGVVGDGARRVEAVTVMTFESAYRQLDAIGDQFAMVFAPKRSRCASPPFDSG